MGKNTSYTKVNCYSSFNQRKSPNTRPVQSSKWSVQKKDLIPTIMVRSIISFMSWLVLLRTFKYGSTEICELYESDVSDIVQRELGPGKKKEAIDIIVELLMMKS